MRSQLIVLGALALLSGCPSEAPPAGDHGHDHPHDAGATPTASAPAAGHGAERALGQLAVAGHTFDLKLLGDGAPGKESALEARVEGASDLSSLNVYAWIEDEAGKQVSPPDKAKVEGGALHFHVTPRAGSTPKRVVLRVRRDGLDERGGLPLDGHGHEHAEGPHDGMVSAFPGPSGSPAAHLELKLHDDKGDLELWLGRDARFETPLDLPLDAVVHVRFIDHDDREVELRARDGERNEDEDGKANVRNGGTNYFIFPGDTGADASWLKGAAFSSIVVVRYKGADGKDHASEEFVLKPHAH